MLFANNATNCLSGSYVQKLIFLNIFKFQKKLKTSPYADNRSTFVDLIWTGHFLKEKWKVNGFTSVP